MDTSHASPPFLWLLHLMLQQITSPGSNASKEALGEKHQRQSQMRLKPQLGAVGNQTSTANKVAETSNPAVTTNVLTNSSCEILGTVSSAFGLFTRCMPGFNLYVLCFAQRTHESFADVLPHLRVHSRSPKTLLVRYVSSRTGY